MRDSNTERIGIYKAAFIFTKDIKWVFREQPIVDVGIDALIEQSIEGNPKGQFIAAQIKTGEGNFHVSENELTHYVTKIHYNYWLNFNMPVILIGHLPDIDETYWENITKDTLQKTRKHWRIVISRRKHLNSDSINELTSIVEKTVKSNFYSQFEKGIVSDEEIQKIIIESKSSTLFRIAVSNIVNLIESLGKKTTENKSRIDHYASIGLTEFDKRVLKTIKNYAEYMNQITIKLNKEIDDFAFHYARGIHAFEKAILIQFFRNKNYKELEEKRDSLVGIIPAMESAINGIKIMRNSASNLPSKYAHLKKAKIKLTDTSNDIINEFETATLITKRLINSIEEIL